MIEEEKFQNWKIYMKILIAWIANSVSGWQNFKLLHRCIGWMEMRVISILEEQSVTIIQCEEQEKSEKYKIINEQEAE